MAAPSRTGGITLDHDRPRHDHQSAGSELPARVGDRSDRPAPPFAQNRPHRHAQWRRAPCQHPEQAELHPRSQDHHRDPDHGQHTPPRQSPPGGPLGEHRQSESCDDQPGPTAPKTAAIPPGSRWAATNSKGEERPDVQGAQDQRLPPPSSRHRWGGSANRWPPAAIRRAGPSAHPTRAHDRRGRNSVVTT